MNISTSPLYFDITDIVEHAMNHSVVTGVQRSVVRILESIVRRDDGPAVYGLLRHPLSGQYRAVDLSFLREPHDFRDFASRFELSSGKNRWLAGKLKRYKNRSLKRLFHKSRLKMQWAVSSGLRAEILSAPQTAMRSSLLDSIPAHGGAVVTLGAGWSTDYAALRTFARLHDCKLVSFVHDIIALSGQFFARDKNGRFRKWIDHIAAESDLILCNSFFTQKEFERYLEKRGAIVAPHVAVVRFPHEFKRETTGQESPIRDEVAALGPQSYVLCVGTVEVRKNTLGLLKAWQTIEKTRREKAPVLVLAGGMGRGADKVQAFLAETSNINGSVTVIHQPGDAELEFLYKHCRFSVFPSWYEGWGLPVGESLWLGKPVLCAARASMPEVGGRFAVYFDSDEPGSLAFKIQELIDHPVTLPDNVKDHLTSWDDTADSLCAALNRLQSETRLSKSRAVLTMQDS